MDIIKELPDDVILWIAMNNIEVVTGDIGYVVSDVNEFRGDISRPRGFIFEDRVYNSIRYSVSTNRFIYFVNETYLKDVTVGFVEDNLIEDEIVERFQSANNTVFIEVPDGPVYSVGSFTNYRHRYGDGIVVSTPSVLNQTDTIMASIDKIEAKYGKLVKVYRPNGLTV